MPHAINDEIEALMETVDRFSKVTSYWENDIYFENLFDDHPPYHVLVAHHSLSILKRPEYLDWMLEKLQYHSDSSYRYMMSSLTPIRAAELSADCDRTNVRSVVKTMLQLTQDMLETVGI